MVSNTNKVREGIDINIAANQRLCEVAFCNFAKPMLAQRQNQRQNVLDEFFFQNVHLITQIKKIT
jgi:hypothetical protein